MCLGWLGGKETPGKHADLHSAHSMLSTRSTPAISSLQGSSLVSGHHIVCRLAVWGLTGGLLRGEEVPDGNAVAPPQLTVRLQKLLAACNQKHTWLAQPALQQPRLWPRRSLLTGRLVTRRRPAARGRGTRQGCGGPTTADDLTREAAHSLQSEAHLACAACTAAASSLATT